MFPRAGQIVGGKYELVRLLGRGSMGEVWRALHRTLGEDVALKLLSLTQGEVEGHAIAVARFRFEAQVAARLSRRTRHIVRVTDHGEDAGAAYLVMELLEGQTLENELVVRRTMPLADASRLIAQVARALEEAHGEGVVHRDLKPGNIFLSRDEESNLLVKLLDFGIARITHTHRVDRAFATGNGVVFGTPGYMSPEQARASKLDARCDLWALATVAYEVLTGDLPIPGASVQDLIRNLHSGCVVPVHERDPKLPPGLAAFFGRAFAPQITERYATAGELASAFDGAIGSQVRPKWYVPVTAPLRDWVRSTTWRMPATRHPGPSPVSKRSIPVGPSSLPPVAAFAKTEAAGASRRKTIQARLLLAAALLVGAPAAVGVWRARVGASAAWAQAHAQASFAGVRADALTASSATTPPPTAAAIPEGALSSGASSVAVASEAPAAGVHESIRIDEGRSLRHPRSLGLAGSMRVPARTVSTTAIAPVSPRVDGRVDKTPDPNADKSKVL